MKNMFLVILVVLSFSACNTGEQKAAGNTNSPESSGIFSPINSSTLTCPVNSVVNNLGNCACIDGYKFDSTGTCVVNGSALGMIKLARPNMLFGVDKEANIWHYNFSAVTDVNSVEVPTAVIRTMHIKIPAGTSFDDAAAMCIAWVAEAMTCADGVLNTGQVNIPNGTFCVKSIACDDNYQPSDIDPRFINIANSDLEGDL